MSPEERIEKVHNLEEVAKNDETVVVSAKALLNLLTKANYIAKYQSSSIGGDQLTRLNLFITDTISSIQFTKGQER